MIAAYVSGHGYGHLTRTSEALRALRERQPETGIAIVSSAPERLFRAGIGGAIEVRSEECDVGLVQQGALAIDEAASLARWRGFVAGWEERVEREAAWLAERGVRLVLGDVPPLAFAAAQRAGVRSVALANFSWDWVYRHYSVRHPGMRAAADWAAEAYRAADRLLRLPFAGDLSVFGNIEDVPLIARHPRLASEETRRRLDLDGDPPLVLWSFGGHGLAGFRPEVLGRAKGFRFILTGKARPGPENVLHLDEQAMATRGVQYTDLVAAADVLVTKPGYGIVTDAVAGRTPLVYTERGDFPEYPILVAEMRKYLPSVFVSNEDLLAGRLEQALNEALEGAWPTTPSLDGADVVASRLLALLE